MEALWTIVPAVIMAALIISGARLWAKIYSPPPADRFIVEVTGEQFKWAFRYPGKDGQFGRTNPKLISDENKLGVDPKDPASQDDIVINPGEGELHLPVGQPVEVLIRSKDVLHSFFLPHMRVKQDAVPGMTTRFWFTPTVTTKSKKNELKRQTQREYSLEELKRLVKSGTPFIADGTYKDKSGESIVEPETPLLEDAFTDLEKAGIQRMKAHQDFNFELYCAELCGLGHYQMFGVVVVEDDIDLYEWLSQQTPFSG
jgi:cytochrome c oxidase subunit 2